MSATLLEAKAVITAEDRTGAAFAAIEKKIAQLGKSAAQVGRMTSQVGAMSSRVAAAQAAADRAGGRNSMLAAGGWAGSRIVGYAGMAATVGAGIAAHKAMHAAAERAHERVRMSTAGMSPQEQREAEVTAAEVAAKTPTIDQTTIMHMLRNARTITGSYEEAAKIMEPMARLRVIAQNARPGEDVTEDFDKLLKGLEIKGVTQHPKEFHDYMEGIAKGLNAFGDTLKPYQYYEMFKYGRQATPTLSSGYILSIAPSVAQEMGGSSFGKATSAFSQAIVGNVMKHAALKDFASLGLIARGDLLSTRTGEAKGLKPGAHVQGWRLAQTNPYEWVKQYLLPALEKAGVTDKQEQMARISAMFQNQQAAQLVGIFTTQQARIEKDQANQQRAGGMASADDIMKNDPYAGGRAISSSIASLAGQVGGDMMGALSGPLTDAAKAIAGYTAELARMHEQRRADPGGPSPGQQKFNRMMDATFGARDHAGGNAGPSLDQQFERGVEGISDKYARLAAAEKELADLRRTLASPTHFVWNPEGKLADVNGRIAAAKADIARVEDLITADRARRQAQAALDAVEGRIPRNMGGKQIGIPHGMGAIDPGIGAFDHDLPIFARGGANVGRASGPPAPIWGDAPPHLDLAGMLNGKITAQAEVKGVMEPLTVTVNVVAGSSLIEIANRAQAATVKGTLTQGGRAPTGVSRPDALPPGAPGKQD